MKTVMDAATVLLDRMETMDPDDWKPIVLMDVDGVVNWWGRGSPAVPLVRHGQVWIPETVPGLFAALLEVADVWWCTAWRDLANTQVSPLLGIPQLKVVSDAPPYAGGADWKADVLTTMYFEGEFGDRPVVWVEDVVASWRNPGMALMLEDIAGFTIVDTSEHGYVRREDLPRWLLGDEEVAYG